MSEWISVEDGLPLLDVPVWTLCKGELALGCRVSKAGRWYWHRCYTTFGWHWMPDKHTWKTYYEVGEYYEPTSWQYIPQPLEVKDGQ
jgi:hypothetical protein